MIRRTLLALLAATSPAAAQTTRPNILFIMTDDHASAAISAYGGKLNSTPRLDALARDGVRFDRCYATNAICSPSRATILTGKYSHRNGVLAFDRFDGGQPTVAKLLRTAGYHTGVVGKWHLASDPTGFDVWDILPGQGLYNDPVFYDASGRRRVKGYATDVTTDRAIEFLEKRPADKPFFLMAHHKAPHRPFQPSERYRAAFAGKTFPEPATLFDDFATRTDGIRINRMRIADLTNGDLKLPPPADLKGDELAKWKNTAPQSVTVDGIALAGDALVRWKYQRYMQDYLACVQSVDDNVGRLVDWIDSHGLRENTIVIYTSDQGFFLGEHGLFDKRYMYEPSWRMPFLVRWPGVARAGGVATGLTINCDFAPTFLAAAGLPTPADMQGVSLVPLLQGDAPADWRKSVYYRYYIAGEEHDTSPHYGVATDRFKLIYYDTRDAWELYDTKADPDEVRNVYADPAMAGTFAELKFELTRLRAQYGDDDSVKWKPRTTGGTGDGKGNE